VYFSHAPNPCSAEVPELEVNSVICDDGARNDNEQSVMFIALMRITVHQRNRTTQPQILCSLLRSTLLMVWTTVLAGRYGQDVARRSAFDPAVLSDRRSQHLNAVPIVGSLGRVATKLCA